MVTSNVIQRTFRIKVHDSCGTGFTIDVDNKQYIVTAKHIVSMLEGRADIEIFHDNMWKKIQVTVVGHCDGDIDISVLTTNKQISPKHPLEASSAGMVYGQDVYFLGFPYQGYSMGQMNRDFPIPFVKKAIVSCFGVENGIYYLDGHNIPGFSGGPVIFKRNNSREYQVCSIISGYKYAKAPVFYNDEATHLESRVNTGIIVTYGIKHAIDLIKANPIGFQLAT